jgi:hypothetical protein
MRHRRLLLLVCVLGAASGCTALVRMAAGPPRARAHQARLALDGQGRPAGIAVAVDLFNENPVDLAAERFDFRLEAGGEAIDGSVAAQGHLAPQTWAPVELYIPLDPTSAVFRNIAARAPYVVTGTLVLAGGMSGLAVGVSGEGVIGDPGQAAAPGRVRVALAATGGGVL